MWLKIKKLLVLGLGLGYLYTKRVHSITYACVAISSQLKTWIADASIGSLDVDTSLTAKMGP